jgi:hypothetical protein
MTGIRRPNRLAFASAQTPEIVVQKALHGPSRFRSRDPLTGFTFLRF